MINNQPKSLNLVTLSLVTSAVLIVLIGISQHLFSYPMLQGSINPAATFGNKNMSAQPFVFILPLGLYLLHNTQKILSTLFGNFCNILSADFCALYSNTCSMACGVIWTLGNFYITIFW
ncbi:MAG: hypothetical protein Rpha_0953 [Candidatus Ruthia sp. Apha_13_S6]|nr:hypothetical protein [Candidatus Ruthia sp. Apha_13_S6]